MSELSGCKKGERLTQEERGGGEQTGWRDDS